MASIIRDDCRKIAFTFTTFRACPGNSANWIMYVNACYHSSLVNSYLRVSLTARTAFSRRLRYCPTGGNGATFSLNSEDVLQGNGRRDIRDGEEGINALIRFSAAFDHRYS